MRVRGPNNVGRAVQTNPALLRYALAITERTKWWQLSLESSQIENELWLRNCLLLKVNRPNHHRLNQSSVHANRTGGWNHNVNIWRSSFCNAARHFYTSGAVAKVYHVIMNEPLASSWVKPSAEWQTIERFRRCLQHTGQLLRRRKNHTA